MDGEAHVCHGPIADLPAYIAETEVIRCRDRGEAIQRATEHPLAREHAIEVRSLSKGDD